MQPSPRRSLRFSLLLRTWHRRIGLLSFVMVLWLAFTGLLINHSDDLAFNQRLLNNEFLNQYYGLNKVTRERMALVQAGRYFHCYDGYFYIDINKQASCSSELNLFLDAEPYWIFASRDEIFILNQEAQFLERVALAESISEIAIMQSLGAGSILLSDAESSYLKLNLETLESNELPVFPEEVESHVAQVEKQSFPEEMQSRIEFPGISFERVLLDLHSGRFFGQAGVYIVDFFALMFMLLSISGLFIYLKKSNQET